MLGVQELTPLDSFYIAYEGSTPRLLIVFGSEIEAVAFNGLGQAGVVEWPDMRSSGNVTAEAPLSESNAECASDLPGGGKETALATSD